VTGGAGFIGANLCRRLTAQSDCEVVVLDDLSTGARSNLVGVDVTFLDGSPGCAHVAKLCGGADSASLTRRGGRRVGRRDKLRVIT
jgi:UDP-glucose 4-epimerase